MEKYTKKELCCIWLDSFLGLEYNYKIELSQMFVDCGINEFLARNKDGLISTLGAESYNTLQSSSNRAYLEFVLEGLSSRNIHAITIFSKNYPQSLKDVENPPLVLYCVGDLSLLNGENFAIVGSRRSLPSSIKVAENFSTELCSVGFNLVTGIAEGVDSAVLTATLQAGGKPISVIAGGIDNVYPKSNAELIKKVAECGLVIAEYPPETVPKPFHFPVRNRIIAGLSKGVLVVSGAIKSGTLYTAEHAESQSKTVFAVPYSVGVPSGAGCNELIKRGALLCDSPQDIIEYYGKEKKEKTVSLTETEKSVISVLSNGETHIEKICSALSKQIFEITPLLSILEMKGLIYKSGNVYGLARNDLEV